MQITLSIRWLALLLLLLGLPASGEGAGFGDLFRKAVGGTNSAPAIAALGEDQVVQGLKEALAKGTASAVAYLGRTNGFLTNVSVRIPVPEKLALVEKTLRAVKQDQWVDDFLVTMNRAAEQAVPEAAGILGNAVKQMTLADAKGILAGSSNAATLYFRRVSETNLYAKFLPIVKTATAQAGVTGAYKKMVDQNKQAEDVRNFGRFFSGTAKIQTPDLDAYVTQKALDGLFAMVAEEERRIRENPAARTSEILQKVFGAVKK